MATLPLGYDRRAAPDRMKGSRMTRPSRTTRPSRPALALAALLALAGPARAQSADLAPDDDRDAPAEAAPAAPAPARDPGVVRLATYNVENWRTHFEAFHASKDDAVKAAMKSLKGTAGEDVMENLRYANDEDQWEIAQVLLDPAFSPDVLVVQEGPPQSDLDYFNKKWLEGMYATVIVFPSNTTRDQNLCALLKPGFRVVETRDKYHDEPDTIENKYGDKLFARGPAFLLVEAPTGYRFWVGTTHQKSKGGNSTEVTAWRNREAARTHEIMTQLAAEGPAGVILMGDTNDELGLQGYEVNPGSGGDATASLVGPPADGFVLETKPLIDAGAFSYGGYFKTDYRSFIDQIVVSPGAAAEVVGVGVNATPVAAMASDHYPVYVDLKPNGAAPTARAE